MDIDLDEIKEYRTEDIRHDLAMGIADGDDIDNDPLWSVFKAELQRRGASIPEGCEYVYCPYSYGKQKLVYK